MRILILTLCCFWLGLGHAPNAFAQGILVKVGNKKINIPAPDGFVEIDDISPATRSYIESVNSSGNRIIGIFLSEGDIGRLLKDERPIFARYMLVQSDSYYEHKHVSNSEFSKAVDIIRNDVSSLIRNLKRQYGNEIPGYESGTANYYGLSLKVGIGDSVPLGVCRRIHADS